MRIAVFGLGYVGVVNVACLSKLGHQVTGCDIKSYKVDLIRSGKSTVLEPQVDDFIREGVENGNINATVNAEECVAATDMALVCVGTPSDKEGNVNLSFIQNTCIEICRAIKKSGKRYTLVLRSTIPPGTIGDQVLPEVKLILGDNSDLVNVAFLPEFLREGNAVKDFFNCARIVAGVDEAGSAKDAIEQVFGFNKKIPVVFTDYRTAEFIKYVDNAYHATKVAFANEVYSVGAAMGVDVKVANDVFLMDDILNISARYLRPGMPFGGSCLPKDLRAILHMGEQMNIRIPFFTGLKESNHAHQQRILDKVLSFRGNKVLFYGITFKQNTDDIRESPFLFLLKDLLREGKEVKVFDPKLNLTLLRIEFPEIVKYIETDLPSLISWADIIILNNKDTSPVLDPIDSPKTVLNCLDNEVHAHPRAAMVNLYSGKDQN